jgi:hypothetical protein
MLAPADLYAKVTLHNLIAAPVPFLAAAPRPISAA